MCGLQLCECDGWGVGFPDGSTSDTATFWLGCSRDFGILKLNILLTRNLDIEDNFIKDIIPRQFRFTISLNFK